MAATKTVNYTEQQTAEMKAAAGEGKLTSEMCAVFAEKFGKSLRSVIAKASREGIYQAKEYKTKTGDKPQKKDSVADAIGAVLKMTEAEVESLTKANKTALAKIFAALANSQPIE